MPIPNIPQPEVLEIDGTLRLRKFDGQFDFALSWYQDPETVMLVDGKPEPYDMEKLRRMYTYLDRAGECYFIELDQGAGYEPVGDVTLWQEDMPIVIGRKDLWGRGVGTKVVRRLIRRGRELGFSYLRVNEIYSYNLGSQRLFTRCGFLPERETPQGKSYRLDLMVET